MSTTAGSIRDAVRAADQALPRQQCPSIPFAALVSYLWTTRLRAVWVIRGMYPSMDVQFSNTRASSIDEFVHSSQFPSPQFLCSMRLGPHPPPSVKLRRTFAEALAEAGERSRSATWRLALRQAQDDPE